MTAEQLLSHILPLLSIDYIGKLKVVIIPDKKITDEKKDNILEKFPDEDFFIC